MVSRKISVVIIGAGFAGLGAARTLLSNSRYDVTLLEGTSKVGGRTESVSFQGGYTAELGCTFLYYNSNTAKSLAEYVKSKGFVVDMLGSFDELVETGIPAVRLLSNGEELPHDPVKHYQEIYFKIQNELTERARTGNWQYVIDNRWEAGEAVNPEKITYSEYMEKRFNSVLKSESFLNEYDNGSAAWEPKHVLEHLNMYEAFMNGTKHLANIDLISQYAHYRDPDDQFDLNCTYQHIADTLASDIPSECIHFNSEVQSIHWTPTGGLKDTPTPLTLAPVTITCTNGTTYQADHVIVTASLGVLQQRCDSSYPTPLFCPQLPQDKLAAINKLGMGKGNTIILEFPKPLVPGRHRSIELYWLEKDYSYPHQYPWATRQYILVRVGNSNIYKAWFTGEDALAVENATETEIAEGMCLVLEKFLKQPIERPLRVEKSAWCQNKLFLGSYSYYAKGSTSHDIETLSQPISGSTALQVLFAGEATHQTLFSTTHGAYDTGVREANRLLQLYTTVKD